MSHCENCINDFCNEKRKYFAKRINTKKKQQRLLKLINLSE